MKVLVACHSRSGHTARLAERLAHALREQGHTVDMERIRPLREYNKWLLAIPLLPLLPFLPLYLFWAPFRRLWHRVYWQPEQAIQPLAFPDVSSFDVVLIGGPKWLYPSFPVARWFGTVRGMEGVHVAPFATYCGPPLRVFEVEMLNAPLQAMVTRKEGVWAGHLHVSSAYHTFFFFGEMAWLFRGLSRWVFARPLQDFTLDGALGRAAFEDFCQRIGRLPG